MPTDAELTTDRDIRIDATGDIATVTGRENIRQQHANAAFRAAADFDPQRLDVNAEADLKLLIEQELATLAYVESATVRVEADPPRTLVATVDSNALDEPVEQEVSA